MRLRSMFSIPGLIVIVVLLNGLLFLLRPGNPYFLEASTRSKCSRVRNDLRSLATGLETYFVDNQAYPVSAPMHFHTPSGRPILAADGSEVHTIPTGGPFMAGLTTPVSYITSLFADPYQERGISFAYATVGDGWILYSPGPDQTYDIIPHQDYDGRTTEPTLRLLEKTYDATNGATSTGDIWRVKR